MTKPLSIALMDFAEVHNLHYEAYLDAGYCGCQICQEFAPQAAAMESAYAALANALNPTKSKDTAKHQAFDDEESEPGFPWLGFCPTEIYGTEADRATHPEGCPYCDPSLTLAKRIANISSAISAER